MKAKFVVTIITLPESVEEVHTDYPSSVHAFIHDLTLKVQKEGLTLPEDTLLRWCVKCQPEPVGQHVEVPKS